MKLHLETSNSTYQIRGYDQHSVTINQKIYTCNLIVMPELLTPWPVPSFEELTIAHFEQLRQLKPDVVLLGTGAQLRFPATELLVPLVNNHIGIEVMTTAAACRTYSVLMAEGRAVAAALLLR